MKKILKLREMKKDQWLILLLAGLLLVVLAVPVSDKKTGTEDTGADTADALKEKAADDYVASMEQRLENTLVNVQGVGNVSVMITLSSTSEKVIEKDYEMSSETTGSDGGKTSSSSETAVYSGSTGEEVPYVKQEISPRIEGVLVVAEGGDNAVVIENITEAVQALFGVDTHKIKVMKHN